MNIQKNLKVRRPTQRYLGDKILMIVPDIVANTLYKLAEIRNEGKVKNSSHKIDETLSDVEMHYIGLKAEWAVASFLFLDIDTRTTPNGDGGYDLKKSGITIDVKMSQKDLKFHRPGPRADIIFLVQPLSPFTIPDTKYHDLTKRDTHIAKPAFSWKHVVLIGWITRAEFMAKHVLRNFGYGDRMVVWSEHCHRPTLLFVNLNK